MMELVMSLPDLRADEAEEIRQIAINKGYFPIIGYMHLNRTYYVNIYRKEE